MALFKKKNRGELELPDFPDLPKEDLPKFPAFNAKDFPSLEQIKKAVTSSPVETKELPKLDAMPKLTETMTYEPKEKTAASYAPPGMSPLSERKALNIPIRKPIPAIRPQQQVQELRPMQPRAVQPRPVQNPMQFKPMQKQMLPARLESRAIKPLFVQIEEYNKIIETVNNLKFSIQEAESILSSMKQLKDRQTDELSRWEDHLNKVKDKLLIIDRKLSEL